MADTLSSKFRSSTQVPAPALGSPTAPGHYDIYPFFPLPAGSVCRGFASLARRLCGESIVILDGYGGMLWEDFRSRLDAELQPLIDRIEWVRIQDAMRPAAEIEPMIEPFLGGDDPLWGTRSDRNLGDFFDRTALASLRPNGPMTILYGTGAALAGWRGLLVYADVPKNEIQYRSRAGSIAPIGARGPLPAGEAYKRFYFVDWPALNRHKREILPSIDVMIDAQRPEDPTWIEGAELRRGLASMGRNWFRPRPWFEPGPWGGQWIRKHIPQLPEAPNYAWSFELIAPENGIAFGADGLLLEVSLDTLMFQEARNVLGRAWARFGYEFPIRFDFLDTFDGGNLSVQCHPRPEYIRRHFGENFTQDETYYILDCEPGAVVWLGFREGFDRQELRGELEHSRRTGEPIDVSRFVNTVDANKHDLFLIPNGTIHCSGKNNLVLEISATPYIFTFKMYDWVRRDLQGNLRPINIERAFDNLYFDRTANVVQAELIARPRVRREGPAWRIVHLPTHRDQFYDVERYEFDDAIEATTDGECHVMNLVEGTSIILETADGYRQRVNYAETFVVPAAAAHYRLINEGESRAMVVKAFVKHDAV